MGSIKVVQWLSLMIALLLHGCYCSSNVIDNCWRGDKKWAENRKKLADCAVGFGSAADGGKNGKFYTVTTSEDDPINPKQGSLRHAVTRRKALWIVFSQNMKIQLKMPLFVASQKTIDGRGYNVHISGGPCLRLLNVTKIIIHGLSIHDCKRNTAGKVLVSEARGIQWMFAQDADAISIVSSSNIWVDHNSLSACDDGLVDITLGSTAITVSNNKFSYHDKVMLLGHSDRNPDDQKMRVTIAFNHFGPGLIERMPRVRYGYAHVVNNAYQPWGIYAIGGSMHPTIRSEGNRFVAPSEEYKKQVTWQEGCNSTSSSSSFSIVCEGSWLWKTLRDEFVNGAYFVANGKGKALPIYKGKQMFKVANASLVPKITEDAGRLSCIPSFSCF